MNFYDLFGLKRPEVNKELETINEIATTYLPIGYNPIGYSFGPSVKKLMEREKKECAI